MIKNIDILQLRGLMVLEKQQLQIYYIMNYLKGIIR